MTKSKKHRARERQKRRRDLLKQSYSIINPIEWRALRISVRKQIARERAMRLWIFPWITAPLGRTNRQYPKASLLGLPSELRQKILYEAFDIAELSHMVKQQRQKEEESAAQAKAIAHKLRQRRGKALGIRMSQIGSDSITMLHRRIGDFCCVSRLMPTDMEYVGKLWKKGLDKRLKWQFPVPHKLPKKPTMVDSSGRLRHEKGTTRVSKSLRGQIVKVKGPGKHARRPQKCWRCEERHFDGGPVCPMARYDPEQWKRMSKKMGGWRELMQPCSLFKSTKIVFSDD